MSEKDIWVDDVGTVFRGTILDNGSPMDISSATEKKIMFVKPDGSEVEKDASFTGDGTDGQLEYATQANDLDQAGEWSWYGKVVYPTGSRRTSEEQFRVWG